MTENTRSANWLLGVVGMIAGGALGYLGFFLLADQGLYAMVLPGAVMGLACGSLSGGKSNGLGIVCAVSALLVGLFTEWRLAPFRDDSSLSYFMSHLGELATATLVLIAIGALFAFWFGKGRDGGVWPRTTKPAAGE